MAWRDVPQRNSPPPAGGAGSAVRATGPPGRKRRDTDPPDCARVIDRVIEHPVPAARAAAMFWRNAVTWGGDGALIDALREIERGGDPDVVMWEWRQTVWVKSRA